jgi:hypothetical protein
MVAICDGSEFPKLFIFAGHLSNVTCSCKPNHPLERLEWTKPSFRGEYWATGGILDTFDDNDPLCCLLCESAELNESWILRSEVHCAAAMIARRIKCHEQKVIPVRNASANQRLFSNLLMSSRLSTPSLDTKLA